MCFSAKPVGIGDVLDVCAEGVELNGCDAVVDDVQDGCQHDVSGLIVYDAEDDGEGQCIESLCEVEMHDAEGEGRDDDCCPGVCSATQHFAFDGFAEEQFFGDGAYDDECEHAPEVVRHLERHLLHDVGQLHCFCHDGDADGSQDACCHGNSACSPVDGSDVGGCDEADVVQEEAADQYGEDVCGHQAN